MAGISFFPHHYINTANAYYRMSRNEVADFLSVHTYGYSINQVYAFTIVGILIVGHASSQCSHILSLEIKIPSRGLIGYRSEFLTDTNGNGIMNQLFAGYEEFKGDIETRDRGSIVVHETGTTTGYGLWNTQDRGRLFVGPGVEVYEGMIVGECAKDEDIVCNVCKKKHVTNTRASGSDEALKLVPPTTLSLEQSMEFLADDELLEVTPKSIRLRKTILDKSLRLKAESRKK